MYRYRAIGCKRTVRLFFFSVFLPLTAYIGTTVRGSLTLGTPIGWEGRGIKIILRCGILEIKEKGEWQAVDGTRYWIIFAGKNTFNRCCVTIAETWQIASASTSLDAWLLNCPSWIVDALQGNHEAFSWYAFVFGMRCTRTRFSPPNLFEFRAFTKVRKVVIFGLPKDHVFIQKIWCSFRIWKTIRMLPGVLPPERFELASIFHKLFIRQM